VCSLPFGEGGAQTEQSGVIKIKAKWRKNTRLQTVKSGLGLYTYFRCSARDFWSARRECSQLKGKNKAKAAPTSFFAAVVSQLLLCPRSAWLTTRVHTASVLPRQRSFVRKMRVSSYQSYISVIVQNRQVAYSQLLCSRRVCVSKPRLYMNLTATTRLLGNRSRSQKKRQS
jgi:hypothetical protein